MQSHSRSVISGLVLAAVSAVFAPAALAQAANRSAQGFMTMKPGAVALGEPFDVRLMVPPLRPEDANKPVFLRWYPTGPPPKPGPINPPGDDIRPRPADINNRSVARVAAPFERPGSYELWLFLGTGGSTFLLDWMVVKVSEGRATESAKLADSVYLKLTKDVFYETEPIAIKVKLPANRYYQGNKTGPNVVLYPITVKGKAIPPNEVIGWMSNTWGCHTTCASLRDQAWIPNSQHPYDYGVNTDTTRLYEVKLLAPPPGVYEVRLYDRGFSDYGYEKLFLERIQITVEEAATTPSVLTFVTLRPPVVPANAKPTAGPQMAGSPPAPKPRAGDKIGDYQEVPAIVQGDKYQVLAAFDPIPNVEPPKERTARMEWLEWSDQVNQYVARQLLITLFLKGPWLYVSDHIPFADAKP